MIFAISHVGGKDIGDDLHGLFLGHFIHGY